MGTKKKSKKVEKKKASKSAKKVAPKKPIKKAKKKAAAKKAAPKKAAPKKAAKKRKPSAAFMKPLTPSDALATVVGSKPLPRTEVVKKIWHYIKANKLQDKTNKRMINADAKLKPIFSGKAQVSMFDMAKDLSKNLYSGPIKPPQKRSK